MRRSGPPACLPRRKCPSLGWCWSEATAVPVLSHTELCHRWWAEQFLCPVTAHLPGSEVGHCVVACLHPAAIPKEQIWSGFGFFTPLGNHSSLLPTATGAHSSDHVWVTYFDYDTCWIKVRGGQHQGQQRLLEESLGSKTKWSIGLNIVIFLSLFLAWSVTEFAGFDFLPATCNKT